MDDARRIASSNEFLAEFAQRLRNAGVEVTRLTTGVPMLHPQIASFSGLWQLGKGVSERHYRLSGRPEVLLNSPINIAYHGGGPVRCRITGVPADNEFPILKDLRAEGLTDYIVLAIPFADGSHKALSFATNRPAGFGASDIALFEALVIAPGSTRIFRQSTTGSRSISAR
jgi:adenylate cyclase